MIQMRLTQFIACAVLSTFLSLTLQASGPWGSGVPGSPEMVALEAKWLPMASSPAKQRGHQRFKENKYGMFIQYTLYQHFHFST